MRRHSSRIPPQRNQSIAKFTTTGQGIKKTNKYRKNASGAVVLTISVIADSLMWHCRAISCQVVSAFLVLLGLSWAAAPVIKAFFFMVRKCHAQMSEFATWRLVERHCFRELVMIVHRTRV